MVPVFCERPDFVQSQYRPACVIFLLQPGLEMGFRPEEQDCVSGENDIVVPAIEWEQKMNEPIISDQLSIF